MTSRERKSSNNKKKYIFKDGNHILSPLNSKNISLNFISSNKKENKSKSNPKIIINNLLTEQNKKNLMQNFSNFSNNNFNILKKLYINKKAKEMQNSKSHKKSNLSKKKLSYNYLKTEMTPSYSNIFNKSNKITNMNIPNITLIFHQKYNIQKSNSNYYDNNYFGNSYGLLKKDIPNYNYVNNRNKKLKEEQNETNQSTNDTNKKRVNVINKIGNKKNEIYKGPEEIHLFFVKSIQNGKKYEKEFDF